MRLYRPERKDGYGIPNPRIEKGTLGTRVEALRTIGADMLFDKAGVKIIVNGKEIDGCKMGAKKLDSSRWIPLRQSIENLGYSVTWQSDKRTMLLKSKARVKQSPSIKASAPSDSQIQ